MHTTPWFHSTKLPNVPAKNLVQVGIGGWQVPREAVKVASERETNIITMNVAPAGLQLPISFRRRCDARSFDEVGDAKLPAPSRPRSLARAGASAEVGYLLESSEDATITIGASRSQPDSIRSFPQKVSFLNE